jgi:hypothetical protein
MHGMNNIQNIRKSGISQNLCVLEIISTASLLATFIHEARLLLNSDIILGEWTGKTKENEEEPWWR